MPQLSPLRADASADVCIVGAGISGITTAYLLCLAGKSVVVLDDGKPGSGMTSVTTAHLTCVLDQSYSGIERIHGEACARLVAQSHSAAINRIDAIAIKERIDCDFHRVTGYLFDPQDERRSVVKEELEAARRAGIRDAVMIGRAPIAGFDTGPCIAFPNQGNFHPLRYLAGLVRAIRRNAGGIHVNTHVDSIKGGSPAVVRAGKYTVSCQHIVVATNAPINDRVAIHTKQAPYMTYAIAARVQPGTVNRALYWDTEEPYHYVRLQELDGQEYLIVGGEDHKSGQASDTAERHVRLEDWARKRFPVERVAYAWAGQVMQSIDGLAFIGRNPLDEDNVYVVTGDSGTGMTHGTIAGMLLTDLILGRKNPWEKIYDPARKPVRAAGTFVKETANMAAQFTDWLKPGEVPSADEIPKGGGAILRRGASLVAAYRDRQGRLHERSAACPHLGCVVHWNEADESWDCPCHGSRFDKLGKVFNGPSNRDLDPIAAK